jgi:hypothetical protein
MTLGEDVERLIDFDIAPDHRIERTLCGRERQVFAHRREGRKRLRIESEARGRR